jgi:membrane associated rhomboid family serine protease
MPKAQKSFLAKIIQAAIVPFILCAIMVAVKILEESLDASWYVYGLYPRRIENLTGIISSAFLHGDYNHLINNISGFFSLAFMLFFFYPKNSWKILILSLVISGTMGWLGSRESYVVGASGWLYALASYLIFNGIFTRDAKSSAITLIVCLFYGSLIWGVFPLPDELRISWENHLYGALVGLFLAYQIPSVVVKQVKKYSWEKEAEVLNSIKGIDVDFEEIKKLNPENNIVYHIRKKTAE